MNAEKLPPKDPAAGSGEQDANEKARSQADEDLPVSLMGIAGFLRASAGYLRPHWKQTLLVIVTIMPEVALETIQPLLLMVLIDRAIVPGDTGLVVLIVGALLGLLTVYGLGRLANLYLAALVGARALNDLRLKVFERLQKMSANYYARHKTGDILSRFTSDLDAIDAALVRELPYALSCILTIIVGGSLMLHINWRLALPIILLLPMVNLGPRLLGSRINRENYRRQQDVSRIVSTLEENIAAQPVVNVFGLQQVMGARFRAELGTLFRSTVRAGLLGGIQGATMTASGHFLLTLAIGIGAFMAVRGNLTVGALVALFELLWFVMSSVQELSGVLPPLQRAAAGMHRIHELLDEQPEIVDANDALPLPPFSSEIVFKNVRYSHNGAEYHLDGIDVTIPARHAIAIVGRSGSGKSTMLSLLMRFHDPASGAITVDGNDLRQVTQESLRSQIGVVFQESFLFNATIRENIRLGMPAATDEDVEEAAKAAEIHDVILSLPRGYDTSVGERGRCLSGGERQRIALARALVRQPAILMLDEPASALDPQTEAAINATLERVSRDRTIISVTHRLASVVNADHILVLERGRVVERGNHEELLSAGGVYSHLWRQQSGPPGRAEGPRAEAAYSGSL